MSRRHALAVLPLALLVAALSGCTPSASIPPPDPSPVTEPLFATDDEALEAATAAYEEFLRVSGDILRDGGADPDRLAPLVSEEVFASESEGFDLLSENGWRALGQSELVGINLQQHVSGPAGVAEVIAYLCVSVANVDIVDAAGVSQAAGDRETEVSFEIVYTSTSAGELIIERKSVWPESAACSSS